MPFFDTFFELPPTGLGHSLQVEKARRVLGRLQLHHPRIERLLEVGPGWGELADLSVAAGIDYHGVEANEARAASLRARGIPVTVAKTPPIPVTDDLFDAVVALNVLEHMPELSTAILFLSEMVRLTRPDGLVCINSPDLLAAGSLFWDGDYTHNFPVTMRRLKQMFTDQGLSIVDATYFAGIASGPLATPVSWIAKLFPENLVSSLAGSMVPRERLYRARLTFMRNVFVIGQNKRECNRSQQ